MTDNLIAKEAGLDSSIAALYGPIVYGPDLYRLLGYRTAAAFRSAMRKGRIPVALYKMEEREGVAALTADIDAWLARFRATQKIYSPGEGHMPEDTS